MEVNMLPDLAEMDEDLGTLCALIERETASLTALTSTLQTDLTTAVNKQSRNVNNVVEVVTKGVIDRSANRSDGWVDAVESAVSKVGRIDTLRQAGQSTATINGSEGVKSVDEMRAGLLKNSEAMKEVSLWTRVVLAEASENDVVSDSVSDPDLVALPLRLRVFIEEKNKEIEALLAKYPPPSTEDVRGHKLVALMKSWEVFYSKVISQVLGDLKRNAKGLLLVCSPVLDADGWSMDACGDDPKDGDEFDHSMTSPTEPKRKSSSRSNLITVLLKTYLNHLSKVTHLSLTSLLNLSKEKNSAFSQRKTEKSRWNVFASMCVDAKLVPHRCVDSIFGIIIGGTDGKNGKIGKSSQSSSSHDFVSNIASTKLKNELSLRWRDNLLKPLLRDICMDVSRFVSEEVRQHIGGFNCEFDPNHHSNKTSFGAKDAGRNKTRPTVISPDNTPFIAEDVVDKRNGGGSALPNQQKDHSPNAMEIRMVSNDIDHLFWTVSPLLELCGEKTDTSTSTKDRGRLQQEVDLYHTFVSSVALEVRRLCNWLMHLAGKFPKENGNIETVVSCITSVENVRKGWSRICKDHHGSLAHGLANMDSFEDRQTFKVREYLLETEMKLVAELSNRVIRQCSVVIIPGVDSFKWSSHTPFMRETRCTFGATSWCMFLSFTARDLELFSDGNQVTNTISSMKTEESLPSKSLSSVRNNSTKFIDSNMAGSMCLRDIFSRLLDEAFGMISLRYICAKPSRVMTPQWKVDTIAILACTSWLVNTVRRKAGLSDYSFNGVSPKGERRRKGSTPQKPNPDVRLRNFRPTILDSTNENATWLLGCDSDAIKEIGKSLEDVEKRCCLLMTTMALMVGDVNVIKPHIKEAIGGMKADLPAEHLNTHKILESAGVFDVLKPIYFQPSRINGCLSGMHNSSLFENLNNTNFDWKNMINRAAFGIEKSDREVNIEIIRILRKRHEINNWEFPALTDKEKQDAAVLKDLLAKAN